MTKLREKTRRRVAMHESGHLVACLALGREVKEAAVERDREQRWLGYVQESRRQPPARVCDMMMISLAGATAEQLAMGDCNVKAELHDLREAEGLASQASGDRDAKNRALTACQKMAKKLLRENWRAVEAVAGVLLSEGKVSGRRAKALWEKAGGRRSVGLLESRELTETVPLGG